jgi:hypothetical protein
MTTDIQRQEFTLPSPSLDEGYWSSLLSDDEYGGSPRDNGHRKMGD